MATHQFEPNVKHSCDLVMNGVRESCLNFSMQETPFSIYLSIRKSFFRNKIVKANAEKYPVRSNENHLNESFLTEQIKDITKQLGEAESQNLRLKSEVEEMSEKKDREQAKIVKLEVDTKQLENELEGSEKRFKIFNKEVKEKDKTIHDLTKENETLSEKFLQLQTKLNNLTAEVNREKKKEAKKVKKRESKEFLDSLKAESKLKDLNCNKCNFECESNPQLQNHVNVFHMMHVSTQTEEVAKEEKKFKQLILRNQVIRM